MSEEFDPHGQPYNVYFNRARRTERDLSELLGLVKGVLADGVVTADEATLVADWISGHPDAAEHWPVDRIAARLLQVFEDGRIDDDERRDLRELFESLVGGTAGMIVGEDTATELPLDDPPPALVWPGSVLVFTGRFAFGPRKSCERAVVQLGAACESSVTRRTNYLVIGTFGSRDWVHTSFGRKIEKAVELKRAGATIAIVGENHWASAV